MTKKSTKPPVSGETSIHIETDWDDNRTTFTITCTLGEALPEEMDEDVQASMIFSIVAATLLRESKKLEGEWHIEDHPIPDSERSH